MRLIRDLIFIFALVLFLNAAHAGEPNIINPVNSSGIDPSSHCGSCHERNYEEWSNTMHAKSSSTGDPLVAAFYEYLSAKKLDTDECDKCHAPLRSIFNKKGATPEIVREGVNCVLCHSIYGRVPGNNQGHGVDYFMVDFTKAKTGPTGGEKGQNVHPAEFISLFKSVYLCGGCHQEGEADYIIEGESRLLCQNCHMPSKQTQPAVKGGKMREKVYRHLFEGGHSETLLGMSAIVNGKAVRSGGKTIIDLNIENSAFHTIPTGFPLRSIYMKIEGLDKNGAVVWTNYKKDPYSEDAKCYFALVFPGNSGLYAHYAGKMKPVKDQRLKPREVRNFAYEATSDKIVSFKVQLFYRLLPKSVMEELKINAKDVPETLMLEEVIPVE